ncbi:PHP domain-containing protein [Leucobacter denitrificans]|uniref:PHP domain-containing protein n=1 Tax=Leucobacter denitrificans TaxID=683042 RepID=A0A7G9S4W1_9MICO|nr:PHP domain-containing protein [Leucobacter denitrificans]QNN62886.1 PHP domain-containing protein [Leucobacter denitrificans]
MTSSAVELSGGYDLHTHSLISDGTTRPAEIAAEAAALGLEGFSLTDHDTIEGWDEARTAARAHGIDFLPGIEVTTRHNWKSRHLLGYGVDPRADELFEGLQRVRDARFTRARRMVELLAADFDISWEYVMGSTETIAVGRPHIADALVEAGYFADRSQVFAEVLHPRSPYYVPTYALEMPDAIALVRRAGGLPVLAHPVAVRQSTPVTPAIVRELVEAGLWGIELEHPENREDWLPPLRKVAAELGLEVTASSDYHGEGKPNRLGEKRSSRDLVERIRSQVATPQ